MKCVGSVALLFAMHAVAVLGGQSNLVTAGQTRQQSLEATWSNELDSETKVVQHKSPIQRVVALLKEMNAQLVAEAEKESEMYDQMVCWCETNDKAKVKAIADAEAKLGDLQAEIESRAAQTGKLSTEIARMKEQIAADEEALKTATALREKQAAEFSQEEKETMQALTNLKNAVAVLSKQQGGSAAALMQLDSPVLASVRAVLRDVQLKYDMLLGDAPQGSFRKPTMPRPAAALLTIGDSRSKSLDEAFGGKLNLHGAPEVVPLDIAEKVLARSAAEAPAFIQKPASYAPQSNAVFGILKQMEEEFESNLSTAQKDEMKSRDNFKALSSSKSAQIGAGKEKLDDLEGHFAENQKALSDAKEDNELTVTQRATDVEFLRNLRVTCQNLDKDWETRSKTRAEETKGVAEALAVLTEDDAADLMRKTVSFFQQSSNVDSEAQVRRSRAAAALRQAAGAPAFEMDDLFAAWKGREGTSIMAPRSQLSTLAVTVELDTFTKVREMMDKMVAELKKQQVEEVKSKSFCEKEFDENDKTTYEKTEEKKDLEDKLAALASTISNLEEEIADGTKGIANAQVEIKTASQDREKENAEFQVTIADQRATQAVLAKALDKLQAFYKKQALVQASVGAAQTPPVQFNKYKKNAGSSTVMGLIEQIVEDSKKLESEALAAEQQSQTDYENFVKDSNAEIASLSKAVTAKTATIASAKMDSAQADSDHTSAVGMLEDLAGYKADLHMQCDFLLKNFSIRQQGRLQEIEAIQAAKGILSGSAQ